jgi:hypothetical protein
VFFDYGKAEEVKPRILFPIQLIIDKFDWAPYHNIPFEEFGMPSFDNQIKELKKLFEGF